MSFDSIQIRQKQTTKREQANTKQYYFVRWKAYINKKEEEEVDRTKIKKTKKKRLRLT